MRDDGAMSRALTGLVTVIAIVACAWFGLGIVQAQDTDHATNILEMANTLSPTQRAHIASLLDSAGTLNPGTSIELLRAQLAAVEHRTQLQGRILERVTREEPLNLDAWLALAQWGLAHDRAVLDASVGHISMLDPRLK
jgi:hypothetical protein